METVSSIEHLKQLSADKEGFTEFIIDPQFFKTIRLVRYYSDTMTFAVYDEQTDIWKKTYQKWICINLLFFQMLFIPSY